MAIAINIMIEKLRWKPTRSSGSGDGNSKLNRSAAAPRVTPGLPSGLINRRPVGCQAEEQLESADYSVESARVASFPPLRLRHAWIYAAAAGLIPTPVDYVNRLAGVAITQPIFGDAMLLGQFEQQRGLQAQYLHAYRKTVLSAFSDVEQALIAVERTTAQVRIQENRRRLELLQHYSKSFQSHIKYLESDSFSAIPLRA
jgi:outer membrane protein TolC